MVHTGIVGERGCPLCLALLLLIRYLESERHNSRAVILILRFESIIINCTTTAII
jgi:hypothetical protein